MRLGLPAVAHDGSTATATAELTTDDGPGLQFSIEVSAPTGSPGSEVGHPWSVDPGAAPFVPVAVVAALLAGEDLDIAAPITTAQLDGARGASALLADWLGRRPSDVTAVTMDEGGGPASTGVGLFFTRGIDSWASLLDHRNRLSHLLFLDGIEPRLSPEACGRVRANTEHAAAELGLPLIILRPNARQRLDPLLSWELTHGAIMASAALALSPVLGEVLIASSHVTGHSGPWGTHADLDPRWSTPATRICHDGGHRSRWDKTVLVAGFQPALDSLYVCFESGHDRNCGTCRKCLLTMSALEGIGALSRCDRFDAQLDLDRVVALGQRPAGRSHNGLDLLVHLPPDSDLARAWASTVDPADLVGLEQDQRPKPWWRRRRQPS